MVREWFKDKGQWAKFRERGSRLRFGLESEVRKLWSEGIVGGLGGEEARVRARDLAQ